MNLFHLTPPKKSSSRFYQPFYIPRSAPEAPPDKQVMDSYLN